jgi:hypothetical protein
MRANFIAGHRIKKQSYVKPCALHSARTGLLTYRQLTLVNGVLLLHATNMEQQC